MVSFFGLYFGNSTASIAQYREDGKVEILANEAGERVTAAVVTLTNQEQIVGSMAGVTSYSLASLTIRNNKKLLDVDISDDSILKSRSQSLVRIDGTSSDDLTYTIYETDKKPLVSNPSNVATLIFKKLYGIASGSAPGQKELSCVICVPRHWSEESRTKVVDAVRDAGWLVLQVVNEPSAALLAYRIGFEKPPLDIIALVYRLGGISCDATVIRIEGGFQTILSHVKEENLGGHNIVMTLTNHLAEEFSRKFKLEPSESRKSMWKLKIAATAILHTLSTVPSCSRFVESVCEGVDFNVTVSRARLDSLISPLISKFIEPITKAMSAAQIEPIHISKVVLCGGVLKIPRVKQSVASMFSCEICSSLNPDEIYALGAAQQAGLIAGLPEGIAVNKPTAKLPMLLYPITVKINQKEVLINKAALPTFDQIVITCTSNKIDIEAVQDTESGPLIGKAAFDCPVVPTEFEIHLRATTESKLHIDAVDINTKDVKKTCITFSR